MMMTMILDIKQKKGSEVMSASPYFYIEAKNRDTGEWEQVVIYTPRRWNGEMGELEPVDVWCWNGTHDLFRMLRAERCSADEGVAGVHWGMPVDASEGIKEKYATWDDDGYKPDVHYVTLADLYINTLLVTEVDNDWDDDPPKVPNPIKDFLNHVVSYVSFWDEIYEVYEHLADIRIVYWLTW